MPRRRCIWDAHCRLIWVAFLPHRLPTLFVISWTVQSCWRISRCIENFLPMLRQKGYIAYSILSSPQISTGNDLWQSRNLPCNISSCSGALATSIVNVLHPLSNGFPVLKVLLSLWRIYFSTNRFGLYIGHKPKNHFGSPGKAVSLPFPQKTPPVFFEGMTKLYQMLRISFGIHHTGCNTNLVGTF